MHAKKDKISYDNFSISCFKFSMMINQNLASDGNLFWIHKFTIASNFHIITHMIKKHSPKACSQVEFFFIHFYIYFFYQCVNHSLVNKCLQHGLKFLFLFV